MADQFKVDSKEARQRKQMSLWCLFTQLKKIYSKQSCL